MKFYDLCVWTGDLDETIKIAKKLGWNGIGFIIPWNGDKELEKIKSKIDRFRKHIDIVLGIKIQTSKSSIIKKIASYIRKRVELIVVYGGDADINRAVVEIPEIDILIPGMNKERNFDYIMARFAAKNNVAIGFCFTDILYSYKKIRAHLLSNFLESAKLIKKYKTPFILTSGALSPWDLRSPSELISFGKILGFQPPLIKEAISDKIVKENKKRLSSKFIMPGVEIE
jgi:ribonuclease P/MRP protein subunit RPP1